MDLIKEYLLIIVPIVVGYITYTHRRINVLFRELHKKASHERLKEEVEEMKEYSDKAQEPNNIRNEKSQEDIKEIKTKQDKMYDMVIEILKKMS